MHKIETLLSVIALVVPSIAIANPSSIEDGAGLHYAGVNKITIDYGDVLIAGTHFQIAGATFATKGVGTLIPFESNVTQGNSTAYYLYDTEYLLADGVTTRQQLVVTNVAPFPDGVYSKATIPFNDSLGNPETVPNSQTIFLGSYVTDFTGNMIPFVREGNEVLLAPGSPKRTSVSFAKGETKHIKSTTFANTAIPRTAVALLVDMVYHDSVSDGVALYVLMPELSTVGCPAVPTSQWELANLSSANVAASFAQRGRVHINDAPGTIYVAACSFPVNLGDVYEVLFDYHGYVENRSNPTQ